jgi:hypothetical protein
MVVHFFEVDLFFFVVVDFDVAFDVDFFAAGFFAVGDFARVDSAGSFDELAREATVVGRFDFDRLLARDFDELDA